MAEAMAIALPALVVALLVAAVWAFRLYAVVGILLIALAAWAYPYYAIRVLLAPINGINWVLGHLIGDDTMEYRGERYQLTRGYIDYDDYKNDRNNLALHEVQRVRRIIENTQIGPEFASLEEFLREAQALKFPGYGSNGGAWVFNTAGTMPDYSPERIWANGIEIPRTATARWIVVMRTSEQRWQVVDDFVTPHDPFVDAPTHARHVRLVDDELVYQSKDGGTIRRTRVRLR